MSERNNRPWFQVEARILDSEDLERVGFQGEVFFWRLMAICCEHGTGRHVRKSARWIARRLAWSLEDVERLLVVLSQPGTDGLPLIEHGPGWYAIVKWDKQPARTDAERKADERAKKRRAEHAALVTDTVRTPSRTESRTPSGQCPSLEGEGEGEGEVEEEAYDARASDAEVRAHWSAYCEGTGRDLPYDIQTAVLLHARSPSPEATRDAARWYVDHLSPGYKPSPTRFASKLHEYLAELQARDKPRLSARERANLEAVQAVLGREATG